MIVIKYILLYSLIELVSISILAVTDNFIVSVIINALLTFVIIKMVEKKYYKKYNELNSLLYNICPLLGILLIFFFVEKIYSSDSILFLKNYYIITFLLYYIINAIYLIICKLKHS